MELGRNTPHNYLSGFFAGKVGQNFVEHVTMVAHVTHLVPNTVYVQIL